MTENKMRFVDHLIQQINRERLLPRGEGSAPRVLLLRSVLAAALGKQAAQESSVQLALVAWEPHAA